MRPRCAGWRSRDVTRLAIDRLQVRHPASGGDVVVLDDVSLRLDAGQSLGLVGESGSGKSQTALATMGLLPASARISGSIRHDGQELLGQPRAVLDRLRGTRMTMVFQDPMTSLNPALSIGLQLAEVPMQHRGLSRAAALAEAARMLDAVRIPDAATRLRQYPHEFSGGMRQRVMIAIALIGNPGLLIADEPTTALDVTVQAQILELLGDLQHERQLALLLITHDLAVVAESCDRVAVMYAGRIVESGPVARVLAQPWHPYTAGLLASRPRLDRPRPERLPSIAGAPPNPARRPAGCAFAPRCPRVMPICMTSVPRLETGPDGRAVACHLAEVETAMNRAAAG